MILEQSWWCKFSAGNKQTRSKLEALWDEGQCPAHSAESIQCLGLAIGLISHRLTGRCINLHPAQLSMPPTDKCWTKICNQNLHLGVEYCPHTDWQGNGVDSQQQKKCHHFQETICQFQNWFPKSKLKLPSEASSEIPLMDELCLNKNWHFA